MATAEQRDGSVVDGLRRFETQLERSFDLLFLFLLGDSFEAFEISVAAKLI
jgi:hypothetical protein